MTAGLVGLGIFLGVYIYAIIVHLVQAFALHVLWFEDKDGAFCFALFWPALLPLSLLLMFITWMLRFSARPANWVTSYLKRRVDSSKLPTAKVVKQ